MEDTALPPLRYLIIDFRLVTGVDTSAIFSLARLKQGTTAADVQVVLTGLNPAVRAVLASEVLNEVPLDDSTARIGWRVMPLYLARPSRCLPAAGKPAAGPAVHLAKRLDH